MALLRSSRIVPEHSIQDAFNKQAYLGNSFVLPIDVSSAGSTSEVPVAYITNPLTSNITLFVNSRKYGADNSAFFRLYKGPTISSPGTPTAALNLRTASPTTSASVDYVSPSISSNGTLLSVIVITGGYTIDSSTLIILDPGETLLVTIQSASTDTNYALELSWYELGVNTNLG